MRSWDYFDTLHGRSTGVDPWRIFDLVGGEEYRKLRQAAELASDKTWPGIFASLRQITGWSKSRIDELRDREEAAEISCGFPIVENTSQVAADHRIVSDTYFDQRQIRRMASAIGLPDGIDIVASWDGKWAGSWWAGLGRSTTVHVGDNPRSDFAKPTAAGVQARRYVGGAWTLAEAGYNRAGRWEVAGAARAARLQNPHPPRSPEAGWWDAAAATNVPFILMAAALVRQYAETARPERIYFVSRDTILLAKAYHRLYGQTVGIFHASRQTFRKPSGSFLTYVKRLAPGTLFVDLHGTGRTMRQFADANGIHMGYVFVCGQRRLQAHAPHLSTLHSIGTGTAVEVMNYDLEGRVTDVTAAGDPRRADVEYDLEAVRVHQAATLAGVEACCRPPDRVTGDDVAQAADAIRRAVPKSLLRQHEVEHRPRNAT